MSRFLSKGCPRNTLTQQEYRELDEELAAELEEAGIVVQYWPDVFEDRDQEVPSVTRGLLGGWLFKRAWGYWIAKGPGIPLSHAGPLHEKFGTVVRVAGNCTCPSPAEWFRGFACDHYHVDTPEGLKALADTIKAVLLPPGRIKFDYERPDFRKDYRKPLDELVK